MGRAHPFSFIFNLFIQISILVRFIQEFWVLSHISVTINNSTTTMADSDHSDTELASGRIESSLVSRKRKFHGVGVYKEVDEVIYFWAG